MSDQKGRDEMKNKIYSVTEVAAILKITVARVRRLIADGRIKAQKLGTGKTTSWMVTDYSAAINRKPGRPWHKK